MAFSLICTPPPTVVHLFFLPSYCPLLVVNGSIKIWMVSWMHQTLLQNPLEAAHPLTYLWTLTLHQFQMLLHYTHSDHTHHTGSEYTIEHSNIDCLNVVCELDILPIYIYLYARFPKVKHGISNTYPIVVSEHSFQFSALVSTLFKLFTCTIYCSSSGNFYHPVLTAYVT